MESSVFIKIFLGILFILSISLIKTMAQTPYQFRYQAVLRDTSGNVLANQNKIVKVDILQSGSSTAAYTESHAVTTTAQGLINLNIGSIEDLSIVDWHAHEYFIQISVDGTIMGTSQLLSVPYALNSKTVENVDYLQITNTPTIPSDLSGLSDTTNLLFDGNYFSLTNLPVLFSGSYLDLTDKPVNATITTDGFMSAADKTKLDSLQNVNIIAGTGIEITGTYPDLTITNTIMIDTLYLGEEYLGGIIFYLYIGSDGHQHGLIVSKTETTAQWQGPNSLTNANRTDDGIYNMGLIVNSAAKTWIQSLGPEWYFPSIDELSILWHNRFHVNKTARSIGSTLLSLNAYFWSSTESSESNAYCFSMGNGNSGYNFKTYTYCVRGIRAF